MKSLFTFDVPFLEFLYIKLEEKKKKKELALLEYCVNAVFFMEKLKRYLFGGQSFTHYSFGKWCIQRW